MRAVHNLTAKGIQYMSKRGGTGDIEPWEPSLPDPVSQPPMPSSRCPRS